MVCSYCQYRSDINADSRRVFIVPVNILFVSYMRVSGASRETWLGTCFWTPWSGYFSTPCYEQYYDGGRPVLYVGLSARDACHCNCIAEIMYVCLLPWERSSGECRVGVEMWKRSESRICLPRTGYSTILCSKYFHGFMTCSEFVLHLLVVLYLPRMMNTIHTNQAQQSYGIFSTCWLHSAILIRSLTSPLSFLCYKVCSFLRFQVADSYLL